MIYNTILFKKIIYLKFYLKNCFSVAEESKDYGKNPFNAGYFWKLDGTDKDVRYHACKENIILHFIEGFNFPKKKVSCNWGTHITHLNITHLEWESHAFFMWQCIICVHWPL